MSRTFKRGLSIIMTICIMITTILPLGSTVLGNSPKPDDYGGLDQSDLAGHWAKPVMGKWINQGLIQGYGDNEYRPDRLATRAEFVVLMNQIFQCAQSTGGQPFADVQTNAWYAEDVSNIYAAGIIEGVGGGKFEPEAQISREDAAVIVARAFRIAFNSKDNQGTAVAEFTDYNQISSYALEAVTGLQAGGYIQGRENQQFVPKGKITRAEIVQLIDNVMGTLINEPGTDSSEVAGNLVVNTDGVTLKDKVISGDLYVTQGVGEGDLILEGVTVKGNMYVMGGGINSIIVRNSLLQGILVINKWNGQVRIAVSGTTEIAQTMMLSGGILEESELATPESGFIDVEVNIPDTVQPKGVSLKGTFRNVLNTAKGPSIELELNSIIGTLIVEAAAQFKGKGTVKLAKLHVSGAMLEQWPDEVSFASGVSATIASQLVTEDKRKQVKVSSFGPSAGGEYVSPSPTPTLSPPLQIVDNSQPAAVIRVALNADNQTQDAAAKLAAYVKKSTGAELPILIDDPASVESLPAGIEVEIYVGAQGLPTGEGQTNPLAGMDGDGFVIQQHEVRITIAGPTAWGTEFGVDEFLERYLGVRWLGPGEDWEDVPQHADLSVPANDFIRQEPAFFSREYDVHATNTPERADWARSNRMHGRVEFKHNLFNLFPPEIYKTSNPDFYPAGAYLDTHGGWQPCFTAEGIVEEAVKNINAYFAANPEATSYSLGVNDGLANGSGYCEDNPNHPDYPNKVNSVGFTDMSDIYYNWVNEVSKGVFAVNPDKYLGLLAYVEVYDPPTNITLDPRVIVYITDDRLSWGDPNLKTAGHELTENWAEAAPGLAFYEYLFGTPYMVPRTYLHILDDNYKYAKDAGVVAHYAELVPNFGEGPKPWVTTRLQWDPEQDVNALTNEWYERVAGTEAAADLAAYYEIWRDFWENRMFQTKWYSDWAQSNPRMNYMSFLDDSYLNAVTPQDMALSRSLLESVVAKAVTVKQKKRAQALLRSFEYYEASAISHNVEERAVPLPTDETTALALVQTVMEKIRLAEKRKDLVEAFAEDSFLQQALSPYFIGTKTLGGYSRIWSGITKNEMDAILFWLEQEDAQGAVHLLLNDLYLNDQVRSVRSYAYILLRSSDPEARKLMNANPGFEVAGTTADLADTWSLWLHNGLEMKRTDEVKKNGAYSIKSKGIKLGGVIQSVAVQPGVHEMSFAYYSPEGTTGKGTIRIQIDLWNAKNEYVGTVQPQMKRIADTAGDWVSMYWAGELPEGVVRVEADAILENFDDDQVVYIDDFYLNRLSPDIYADYSRTRINANASFETAGATPETTDAWSYWVYQENGTIQRTSDAKKSEAYGLKATGIGVVGGVFQSAEVQEGLYEMSTAYYSPEGSTGNGTIKLQLEFYDAQNNYMSDIRTVAKRAIASSGVWSKLEWIGEIPEGASRVNIGVILESFAPDQVLYVDDAYFNRLSPDIHVENPKTPINVNSSFETAGATLETSDYWGYWIFQEDGMIQRSTDAKKSEAYGLKATGIGIIGGIFQSVTVQSGVYGMSASYYSPEGSTGSGTIRLQLDLYDAENNFVGEIKPAAKLISSSAGGWSEIEWVGEIPAGVSRVNMSVLLEAFDAEQEIYLDDVKFWLGET
ncbi:DUF4838 domain-containing protein [Paenibacillus eucommiae]|uniref:SLH domain-containing protein n=1 Tax=Paenibacillus eucommiae TaxID=1355755 RepID=A0ABS4J1D1_9BACL|nr:DUF4838 domain-containing protein [Paenibacillus eucommiae]MBP1993061.1 hypothetical protein [Paenibacillus eucommiae]